MLLLDLYRFVFFLPVVTGSAAARLYGNGFMIFLSGILNFVLKSSHIISQNIGWVDKTGFDGD